jgi:hypothetical protein
MAAMQRARSPHPPKQDVDFIVIGAQKTGTTTLFQHLRHHPEVALPVNKEAPFFSHDAVYHRGWQAYMQALARDGMTDPSLTWGTVTPQYMAGGVLNPGCGGAARRYDEGTLPRRVYERLPDARLVAILRDPVERAISHHAMMVRRGAERRTCDEAFAQLLAPGALEAARARPEEASAYVVWGEYARILEAYLDLFPREQLLILFTDELERAPLDLLRSLHRFIGVREDFVPPNVGERYLVGRPQRGFEWRRPDTWLRPSSPVSPQGVVQRGLRRLPGARAVWHRVPFDGQRRLRRPYERATAAAAARNRGKAAAGVGASRATSAPAAETVARLREHFAHDAGRLAVLLDGAAPYWEPAQTVDATATAGTPEAIA